ncbi:hypothetical protein [Alterisphingorhabdus coralli]|uniref:OmpA-like domain-containing protein n=1 Tax=Alterisphingorhabdus coralli TaxID=3071408 RepID=A0AA97F7L6_9SPHN|nr:hypothetical protein [Parasphingorhabdus sp. SCSIO 66989]WOE74753.1 hypothetical protein RB602_13020 [Parasphingorhabdus sp. SCSIO 66989]
MSRRNRTMTGFLDLALIMVGATALVAQVTLQNATESDGTAANEAVQHFRYAPDQLFAAGEARLSASGQAIIANLVPEMRGANIRVKVPLDGSAQQNRLNKWELASARTAAIFHALHQNGVAEQRLESTAMRPADNAQGAMQIDIQRVTRTTE